MSISKKRRIIRFGELLLLDILSVFLSIILGFRLRFGFEGDLPRLYSNNLIFYIIILTLVAIMSNILLQCYRTAWKYFGYKDLFRQFLSGLMTAVFVALIDNFVGLELPFEMFIILPFLIFLFMVMTRFFPRALHAFLTGNKSTKQKAGVRTLIYGAGEAGHYLLSNLKQNGFSQVYLVGFLDDDERLWGLKIENVSVLGGGEQLEAILKEHSVEEVIIAIPSAQTDFVKEVYFRCRKLSVVVKRYGSLEDVTVEDFEKAPIKQVDCKDLLRRNSVLLNMDIVSRFIKGKTVLVTGGVGSIGSEICRQVLKFGAARLLVFDINENGLFFIKNELDELHDSGRFEVLLGSIRDRTRLREIFVRYKPEIVFHAAAHKHVPMMEGNPKEAIKNNVFGTINVANEAILHHTEKFILISTDKAVNPTNIMGASKRIAEIAIQVMNSASDTDFAAVRFGNVLGSNGSVVPFFEKQIEQGGPVTVTHRDMKRYFMTIPEAVQLVLEAGAMATGGEIFVLDMGEPVYIYDLACDLIRMHGMEPQKDIEIKITGLRPGEKLFEEISLAEEDTGKTSNNKIFINRPVEHDAREFSQKIGLLKNLVNTDQLMEVFRLIQELVPTFHHAMLEDSLKNTDGEEKNG